MFLKKKVTFLGLGLLMAALLGACGDNTPTSGPAATVGSATTAASTTSIATTAVANTTSAATSAAVATTSRPTNPAATTAAAGSTMSPGMTMTSGTGTTAAAGSSTTAAGASSSAMMVKIQDFKFDPETLTVPVGTKITWMNADSVGHTVTGDDSSSPLKSELLKQGEKYEFTFSTAGTFNYHCQPHPFMKGKIVVTPK